MRWLFLLLVTVNIAILIWGVQREKGTSAELDSRYRNVGEIKLLSRADIESLAAERISERDVFESVAGSEETIGKSENNSAIVPEVSETELTPQAVSDAETEEVAVASAASPDEDDESLEAAVTPVPAVAEITDDPLPVQFDEPEPVKEEAVVQQKLFCWTLGPIKQRPAALNILQAVEKKVFSAALREAVEKSITGYWVVLPPYENARIANQVVEQLKSRDVVDVQRFYKGELQNGVSLGVYNQRYNAEKRRAQIETKGFSPEVLPRYNEVPAYWVDYRSENEADILNDLPSGYRDLAVTRQECHI